MLRSRIPIPPTGKPLSHSLQLYFPMSVCLLALAVLPIAHAQGKDPGPRPGASGAGSFFSTLNANEQLLFNQALARFQEVDSVSGKIEAGSGLGPTYNANSCALCHAQPAVGGSSP